MATMSSSFVSSIHRGAVPTLALRVQTHCRTLASVPDSSGKPSATQRRRSSKQIRDIDIDSVDLVGPPDAISNIRPVVYAQVEPRAGSSQGKKAATKSAPQPHPYSTNEFSQQSHTGEFSSFRRRAHGLGVFKSYRDLVDRVSDRVEEGELQLRLAKLSTDSTTQRFWRDNNQRFSRDLESWRLSNHASSAEAMDKSVMPVGANEPSSESDFYATWLRANSKRNKAYNVLVWKQAWNQVHLGVRVAMYRTWLRILRHLEG